ncbi:MAG: hypothetical protein IIC06_01700 [Proteobacteria bacterium]|nr:hypothetical protein [Pseudomonadota bacterium]
MIDSPVRPYRRLTALGRAAAVLLVAGLLTPVPGSGAEAQQDKPIRLAPLEKLTPPPGGAGRPVAGSPGRPQKLLKPAEPLAPATVPPVMAATGTGVLVGNLQTIDPDTAGTLTAEQGGFGAGMWLGTERSIVERLLPQMPVNASSAAMRDLMRRMLLSTARVPEGKAHGTSLVAIRVKLLSEMGDLVAVNNLLNVTPGRATDPELVRLETDARFLANDNARACALAGGQIRDHNVPYWQKAFIFCQALAGQHEKAGLGVSLMKEAGGKDEVFFSLIESLRIGEPVVLSTLPDPTPLQLALARVAKAKLPPDVISSNRPGVLRTIAISPNAPVDIRLEAAERAEATGALPLDSLRQLYSSVSFSEDDVANPLSRAETEGGPMTRALLYHTSLIQTVPTAQAEVVGRALALGREEGRYASVVRVFMPVLKRIPPSAELLWFVPDAIRALLLNGETIAAEGWFALLRASALFNKETGQVITRLMPIVRLMGSPEAADWSTSKLPDWWKSVKDTQGAPANAALLYSLFDALGEPVPAPLWENLVTGTSRKPVTMPQPALWFRLIEATEEVRKGRPEMSAKTAQSTDIATDANASDAPADVAPGPRRRIAETVLLSLLALGEAGPAGADPLLIRQVLISLRAAGFEKEARAMAVEAALAAGL